MWLFVLCFTFFSSQASVFATDIPKTTPSSIPISELESYIDNYVVRYIDNTTVGASIVVLKDNEVVHEKGYGFTDLNKTTEVDASTTVFEWGSISKLFVWVSALQLVEQGKLDLDEPISTYLDKKQMPKLQYKEPLTMLHLMNHTAGFEEYIVNLIGDSKSDVEPLADALRNHQPYQAYPPGEVVAYSNYSTSLAALIIENITGQSFEQYAKQAILEPLDMNDTIVTIANDEDLLKIKDKRATGYVSGLPGQFVEMPFSYISLYPSGSLNGPATDLAKFANALLAKTEEENKLFNSLSTLDLLYTSTYSPDPNIAGIAHGFWEYFGKFKSYSHGGNTSGFAANFHVVPEDNFAVIILTNQVQETDISYGLIEALLGHDQPIEQRIRLPLNTELNYDQAFISARNTDHTFTKLFFHLGPLTITPLFDEQLLQLNFAGMTAKYEQVTPNGFRLIDGSSLFLGLKDIYLFTDGTSITLINAPFNAYLPTNISVMFVIVSLILLVLITLYMLVFAIIYYVKAKRSNAPLRLYATTMLLQVISFINIAILAVRMLIDANKTSADIMLHFYINYGIVLATVLLLGYMTYKAFNNRVLWRYSYISTVVAVLLYQAIVIFWRFYWI